MTTERKPYDTDATDAEWAFVAPYLALISEDAAQREHSLREAFNALRRLVRSGSPPAASRPSSTTSAPCSDSPTTAVLDGRILQSTPESGGRARYDGHKRRRGSKAHMAVDTLGHLLALRVTPADGQERAQVGALADAVQEVTGESVELAYADQGYTGEEAFDAAAGRGILLHVVKLPETKRGFVLLPRRWMVERSFGGMTRFRRLARDYERLETTLAGLHYVAFASLMLNRAAPLFAWSA